jgi:predicted Zn-dependent protease with MMP-like domain
MTTSKREYFDQQVTWVLDRLPKKIQQLLEEIPLIIEDIPSQHLMREIDMDIDIDMESAEGLCGCFIGVPWGKRYNWQAQVPNMIILFRQGICSLATNDQGTLRRSELRRQIRITLLHELGHFYGLDENELDQLGYG